MAEQKSQPAVTAEEFEQGYAARSGVTVAWLHAQGRRARPCDCDWPTCAGWQMISDDNWLMETDFDAWRQKHGDQTSTF